MNLKRRRRQFIKTNELPNRRAQSPKPIEQVSLSFVLRMLVWEGGGRRNTSGQLNKHTGCNGGPLSRSRSVQVLIRALIPSNHP